MRPIHNHGRSRAAAVAIASVASLALAASAAFAATGAVVVVGDLDGPRGVAAGPGGRVVFAEGDGTVSSLTTKGRRAGEVDVLGKVPAGYIAPAVAANGRGTTYVLKAADIAEGAEPPFSGGLLFRWIPGGGMRQLADIGAYQQQDIDPFDLEEKPTDSNPFGVAALPDGGALVADAAGNDLLQVTHAGRIHTVAVIKPRTTPVPPEWQAAFGLPPVIPTEAVATSVTVGPDGYYYVGELRGFPGTPGYSQIWRIAPGSVAAICDPENPDVGSCRRYADGFTSIVDLEAGPDGSLYVVELDKAGWLTVEGSGPTEGSVIRLAPDGTRTELAAGELVLPGGVAVDNQGQVYVTAPVFGPGAVLSIP